MNLILCFAAQCSKSNTTSTYHPHETNCSMFYQCFQQYHLVMNCPANMEFNRTTLKCAPAQNSECNKLETAVSHRQGKVIITKINKYKKMSFRKNLINPIAGGTRNVSSTYIQNVTSKRTSNRATNFLPHAFVGNVYPDSDQIFGNNKWKCQKMMSVVVVLMLVLIALMGANTVAFYYNTRVLQSIKPKQYAQNVV